MPAHRWSRQGFGLLLGFLLFTAIGCTVFTVSMPGGNTATATPVPPTLTPLPVPTNTLVAVSPVTPTVALPTLAPASPVQPAPTVPAPAAPAAAQPAPWPTPTLMAGLPPEMQTYVQTMIPYLDEIAGSLTSMGQMLVEYSTGNVTVGDVNASLEVNSEVIVNAYNGILATVPPAVLSAAHQQIANEVKDVTNVIQPFASQHVDQLSPTAVKQAADQINQAKDRSNLVNKALSDQISIVGAGKRPSGSGLQLPDKGQTPKLLDQGQSPRGGRPSAPEISKPALPTRSGPRR